MVTCNTIPKCRICKSIDVDIVWNEVCCKVCKVKGCRFTQIIGSLVEPEPDKVVYKLKFDELVFIEDYSGDDPQIIAKKNLGEKDFNFDGICLFCNRDAFYQVTNPNDIICKSCLAVQGRKAVRDFHIDNYRSAVTRIKSCIIKKLNFAVAAFDYKSSV